MNKPSASAAHDAYLAGNYALAVELQRSVVDDCSKTKDSIIHRKHLALYLCCLGQLDLSVEVLKQLLADVPNDPEVLENLGFVLIRNGCLDEAIDHLQVALELAPGRSNACDAICHAFGRLGRTQEVKKYGRRSLELKAEDLRAVNWPTTIPATRPKPFRFDSPQTQVIAFSLWGSDRRYLAGAIRNAELAGDLYPGWTCRFYCGACVPPETIFDLARCGAQVILKPSPPTFFEGLLWRFEVIDDPGIDRFLVRDADSVINIKERVAVDEWLASDQYFHVMRDNYSHTELILAGMWGGVGGVLPSVDELRGRLPRTAVITATYDQILLRQTVWPIIRDSVLIHDSVFTGCLGSRDFPPFGSLPPDRHVGENEAAVATTSGIESEIKSPLWVKATELHKSGDLDAACDLYRTLLATWPGRPAVLNYLGVAMLQKGETDQALKCLYKSVAAAPQVADFRKNLEEALQVSRNVNRKKGDS